MAGRVLGYRAAGAVFCAVIIFLLWKKKGPCPLLHTHRWGEAGLELSCSCCEHLWIAHRVSGLNLYPVQGEGREWGTDGQVLLLPAP